MLEGKHYRISAENVAGHELIGLRAIVAGGSEKSRVGTSGWIVDETKNLLMLETRRGIKKIPKKESVFALELGEETVNVDGKSILARPEDRTKLWWRSRQ
jgi:ribonuclease P protein subunit POP4